MGTHVNILLLVEKLRNSKKRQGECCIFIDYKSAYNTINRNLLYRILKEKKILTNDEVEFMKSIHDAVYFKCNGKRFYLKNGVHQGSPISPALFDIYMEHVIAEVLKRCAGFDIWYKLYADDLVVTVSHQHLEEFLVILHEVSHDYDLIVNPKKCGIFAVKNHNKITDEMNLRGIPVVSEYCYLGVTLDESGSLWSHLEKIKKRSNYLRANMRYYSKDLSFENQYLLWSAYVRPYYIYTAPVIETQTQTIQKRFHSSWRNSFKQFMGLPSNLPSNILERIFH